MEIDTVTIGNPEDRKSVCEFCGVDDNDEDAEHIDDCPNKFIDYELTYVVTRTRQDSVVVKIIVDESTLTEDAESMAIEKAIDENEFVMPTGSEDYRIELSSRVRKND